ncbi:MAG: hypothetical protein BV459_01960 [Thermoplasmata archaeon M11B2D]|nr:MAG: hypothetical protein BV459_01960 [Thermoplasmata archaeon M11B2D]
MAATIPTAEEVMEYLEYATFELTVDKIAYSIISKMTTSEIFRWLESEEIDIDSLDEINDPKYYIWSAGLCLYMEYLSMRGQIQQTSGDIKTHKVGDVMTDFQRWQPLFFFAKGMAEDFYNLLPHETYRMKALQFLQGWKTWKFKKTNPGEVRFGTAVSVLDMNTNTDKKYTGLGIQL